VLPAAPRVEELSATFVGEQMVIRWKATNAAHCLLSNSPARQETAGATAPFTPDRLRYTLTAVNGARSTSRDLNLFPSLAGEMASPDPKAFGVASDASLLVVGESPNVPVYEGRTFVKKGTAGTGDGWAPTVVFSPDNLRFFVGGWGRKFFANVFRADLALIAQKDYGVMDATYSPDGRSIFVNTLGPSRLMRVDAQTLEIQQSYAIGPNALNGMCVSADGKTLFIIESKSIHAIDVASGARIRSLAGGASWTLRYWEGGGREYLISGWGVENQHIRIIDARTFGVVKELPLRRWIAVTAAEVIGLQHESADTFIAYDLVTLSESRSFKIIQKTLYGAQHLAFAAGALIFSGWFKEPRYLVQRYVAVRAEAAPAAGLLAKGGRRYAAIRSGSRVVVVAAPPPHDVLRIDVAVTAAAAEAPDGWRAEKNAHGWSFTPGGPVAKVAAFAFDDAKNDVRVTEYLPAERHDFEVAVQSSPA